MLFSEEGLSDYRDLELIALREDIALLQAIRENQGKLIGKFAKDNRLLMQENRALKSKMDYWKAAYYRMGGV